MRCDRRRRRCTRVISDGLSPKNKVDRLKIRRITIIIIIVIVYNNNGNNVIRRYRSCGRRLRRFVSHGAFSKDTRVGGANSQKINCRRQNGPSHGITSRIIKYVTVIFVFAILSLFLVQFSYRISRSSVSKGVSDILLSSSQL